MRPIKIPRAKYNASTSGTDLTLDQMIEIVDADSIAGLSTDNEFEKSLRYDITRNVVNILGNAVIKYDGITNVFCSSLQNSLADIYFQLYQYGKCYVYLSDSMSITGVSQQSAKGSVLVVDKAWQISNITQAEAATKALLMYGVITNAMYSVIDERGLMGIFSPKTGTVIKASQAEKIQNAFKTLFGIKKGQRKFGVVEVGLDYSGVTMPVKELELPLNKKDATTTTARIFNIQEDMILGGSTFENKENAIIQTYTDYKGLIYNYISQIEKQLITLTRRINLYDVSFPGVPQLNKTNTEIDGE